MITIEGLKACGVDVETGLARCLDKEDFYLNLIDMGIKDAHFEKLGEALAKKDYDEAFEQCHALKGLVGNLALEDLYQLVCQMTELLRNKTDTDYSPLYSQIMEMRNKIKNL